MEHRHTKITEGAGLEESKLNQDFIEWLQRWSVPILVGAAVVAGAVLVKRKIAEAHTARENAAFAEYEAAVNQVGSTDPLLSISPDTLLSIAEEYAGIEAIPTLCRLKAADVYLEAVRAGLIIGTTFGADDQADVNQMTGHVNNPDVLLTDELRQTYLDKAAGLYRQVLDARPGVWHEAPAMFGLAAVAECRGDLEAARTAYQDAKKLADDAEDGLLSGIAQERLASLDQMTTPPKLYAAADLPPLPWEKPADEPAELEQQGPTAPPADGAAEQSGGEDGTSDDGAGGGEAGTESSGDGTDRAVGGGDSGDGGR